MTIDVESMKKVRKTGRRLPARSSSCREISCEVINISSALNPIGDWKTVEWFFFVDAMK